MDTSLPEALANAVRIAGLDDSTCEIVADGIFVFRGPGGDRAVEIWKTLSAQSDSLGGWPVIVGDPQKLYIIKECLTDRRQMIGRES